MTKITFFSEEPNEEFKALILAAGHQFISWTPPKKLRKNSRHVQRTKGDSVIEMDREQAPTMWKLAEQAGVPFAIGGWQSDGS
jgi:hypothetical protein